MGDRGTAGGQMTLESGGGLWRTAAGDFPIAGAGPGPNAPPPVVQPSAHCRIGAARRDVTPPVGIYNRNWGAAVSDVASGVHVPGEIKNATFIVVLTPIYYFLWDHT